MNQNFLILDNGNFIKIIEQIAYQGEQYYLCEEEETLFVIYKKVDDYIEELVDQEELEQVEQVFRQKILS